jgi:hypothetical protein
MTDVGKSAKRMGKLHPKIAREFQRDPPRPPGVPPHKMKRQYVLVVTTTRLTISTNTHRYVSKQARDMARREMDKAEKSLRPWDNWRRGDETYATETKTEYVYRDEVSADNG